MTVLDARGEKVDLSYAVPVDVCDDCTEPAASDVSPTAPDDAASKRAAYEKKRARMLDAFAAKRAALADGAAPSGLADECKGLGGVPAVEGAARRVTCAPPTSDAGKACRSNADCEARCDAPPNAKIGDRDVNGTCAARAHDGCQLTLDEDVAGMHLPCAK